MTIDEFMSQQTVRNQWLDHPDFDSLYLRKSSRYFKINGHRILQDKVIEIASITSKKMFSGAFNRLINYLETNYPDYVIYIENIQNPSFKEHLLNKDYVLDEYDPVRHSLVKVKNEVP